MGLVSLFGLVCSCILYYIYSRSHSQYPLPPGPKRFPIIGNWKTLSKINEPLCLAYAKWAKEYGEVFYLEVFGESVVVVNSAKAVNEIFERRSVNYSDRPRELYPAFLLISRY